MVKRTPPRNIGQKRQYSTPLAAIRALALERTATINFSATRRPLFA
jgi:hypothetical protein